MSSESKIHLNVITPDSTIFSGDAKFVVVRTKDGELGILPRHANLVAALDMGLLRIDTVEGEQLFFANFGGFMDVKPDEINIVTPNCELPSEIDVDRAERAKERAEERLKSHHEDVDFDRARLALERALLRIEAKHKV
ncbi:ATP synthase F1 subunit epsilon [uncultured Veillonella sp.]|uniref:ATP synthase F1 subunit epsilon n=1 Tax=uncultured Veillonella sp. TaxID=159268 RepID=UPI0025E4413E|nr:ATP synthase F1 subunit epsilon [uncultured Veillonella sp.]